MQITTATLSAVAGRPPNVNMLSALRGLEMAGVGAGLNRPHRLAHFLAQTAHESMGWHYDREVWGPTAAQKRYDTRTDLGNTAAADGDGFLYRGRGPIQITGRSNYRQFTEWARRMDAAAPDFVANPDAVLTDPWEGLVAIWFWETRALNLYADHGDINAITRRINGGTNGLADRQDRYAKAALVLLGIGSVERFQADYGLKVDGIAGPKTREAMHKALLDRPLVKFGTAPIPRPVPKPAQPPAPALRPGPPGITIAGLLFGAAVAAFAFIKWG